MDQPPSYVNQQAQAPMPAIFQDDEAAANACAVSLISLREVPVEEVLPLDSSVLRTSQDLLPREAVTTATNGETAAIPPTSPSQRSADVKATPRDSGDSLESTDVVVQPSKAAEHDQYIDDSCHPAFVAEAIRLITNDEELEVASDDDAVKSEDSSEHLVPEVIDLTEGDDELEVVSDDCPMEPMGNSQYQALSPEVIDLTKDDDDLEEILAPRALKRKRGSSVQLKAKRRTESCIDPQR